MKSDRNCDFAQGRSPSLPQSRDWRMMVAMNARSAAAVVTTETSRREHVHILTYALHNLLATFYRHPERALAAIDSHVLSQGIEATFQQLHQAPEAFGTCYVRDPDPFLGEASPLEIRGLTCYALAFRHQAQTALANSDAM